MSHELLWTPSEERIANSNASRFVALVKERCGFRGATFNDLWKWSVTNTCEFWNAVWDFTGVIGEKGSDRMSNGATKFWEHRYFPDAKLNFAENLLLRKDDGVALIFWGEDIVKRSISWKELYESVARTA
ncbi:MAG: hypothetical protein LBQ43_04730, partial [Holosporales bacterium]|nr:hypothetical protein [Holosporales bacterium]